MPFPIELVQQVGGALGTASAAAAVRLFHQFRKIAKDARNAVRIANETAAALELLKDELEDRIAKAIQPEITSLRTTIKNRASSEARASRPDLSETARRFDELQDQVNEISRELKYERDERNKVTEEIRKYVREDMDSWRDLLRTIGQLEGQIGSNTRTK